VGVARDMNQKRSSWWFKTRHWIYIKQT